MALAVQNREHCNVSFQELAQWDDVGNEALTPHENENVVKTMVLLATAIVNVQIGLSIYPCRALCDSGAQLNLMTAKCAKRLGVRIFPCNRVVSGIGNAQGTSLSKSATIDMRAISDEQYIFTAEFTIINELTDHLPHVQIPKFGIPDHVSLADPKFDTPAEVELIFGAGIWAKILGPKIFRNSLGTVLQETEFGYVVFGRVMVQHNDASRMATLGMAENVEHSEWTMENLAEKLRLFWEIQELSEERIQSKEEQLVEQEFVQNHRRRADGRYVVRIPITPNAEPLGQSRAIALKRFYWLEARLARNPSMQRQYVEFMREYEQLGHMKEVTREPVSGALTYYIPHHCVLAKFRVVFDASCKTTSGKSFNDIQMVGEKLQHELADTLTRFRRHRIGVAGDIEKMFRQVCINPEQWDAQRIIWRENPGLPLREYWLTVVTYGMASSVHSSVRAMVQCANDHEKEHPEATKVVKTDFYVDDCFTLTDDVHSALFMCKEMDTLLKRDDSSCANGHQTTSMYCSKCKVPRVL